MRQGWRMSGWPGSIAYRGRQSAGDPTIRGSRLSTARSVLENGPPPPRYLRGRAVKLPKGEQIVLVTLFGTTVIVRGQNIDLSQLGDDLFRFVDPLGISVLLR